MPPKHTINSTTAPAGPTPRARVELVATARAHIDASTGQLEDALGNMTASHIAHPILEELREAILINRRMLARAADILKRIP